VTTQRNPDAFTAGHNKGWLVEKANNAACAVSDPPEQAGYVVPPPHNGELFYDEYYKATHMVSYFISFFSLIVFD
jgi:hypothetical protein